MRLSSAERLSRDLAISSKELTHTEARFMVDAYYQMQENRKRSENQVRSMGEDEPHGILTWLAENNRLLENQIKRSLDKYSDGNDLGRWARSIVGIGPVIASGLLAHIDIHKAPTAGHIWAFAGLDPTKEWKKGEKRPWNAALKCLCWKLGESFVKSCRSEDSFYGKYYLDRKEYEIANNEALKYKDQAEAKLKKFKIGKDTDAYKCYSIGKLPPAHIHRRACRYAVKLFLSHYHHMAYKLILKQEPPLPYPIAMFENHVHMIDPPY